MQQWNVQNRSTVSKNSQIFPIMVEFTRSDFLGKMTVCLHPTIGKCVRNASNSYTANLKKEYDTIIRDQEKIGIIERVDEAREVESNLKGQYAYIIPRITLWSERIVKPLKFVQFMTDRQRHQRNIIH